MTSLLSYPLTDAGNGERLVARHGCDLRRVGAWGKWLAWDGVRWSIDDDAVFRASKNVVRELYAAGAELVDEERRKAVVSFALRSESRRAIEAAVSLAGHEAAVAIAPDMLDRDHHLLTVRNGTIDLRTGDLRPHRRDDLISRLAPVDYDPDAAAPTWTAFLMRAMGDDRELVEYVQRITGYALTGDVGEHVLAFLYGLGANGKSTFLATLHRMLGDYATPAPRGLLFRARGERHPTELATLYGRRFVTCSEIEEGQAFDEALIKDLTGGDPIEARRMREDFWSFAPTHKLFLAGNHKPSVRGDDEGIWRRMRLIPWLHTIPEHERDTRLLEKLCGELSGILAWAVRGCLDWQRRGLDAPAVVRDATTAYRDESDLLGQFLRLRVVFEPEGTIARKALRDEYEQWCDEAGTEPLGAKRFAGRLRERGVRETSVRTATGPRDGWRGVRLATDAERVAASRWVSHRDVLTTSDGNPVSGPCTPISNKPESGDYMSLRTTPMGDG